jgi:imidazolonepropionase
VRTNADGLVVNARLATLAGDGYGLIERGALAWRDGLIAYTGAMDALPVEYARLEAIDAEGRLLTPGLIDCHTHLVFAGNRVGEFEQRLEGASYEAIARAGGGIVSSIRATRAASEDALFIESLPRARALLADGVTTLEIKSGYGLDTANEIKMLRVARRIGTELGITVRTSFLGAHALPPEFSGRADDYIDLVCNDMLPAVAAEKLADAVDAFCENIGFTPAQTRCVFDKARALGLPVKLHADQLSDLGGVALAASFRALSADHLECTGEAGVRAMAAAGSVAVLLPGAFYALGETRLPPVALLREHGVPMAVASDLNPGTSPFASLQLQMNFACTLFGLSTEEALLGVTRHAARALGLRKALGSIEPGKIADLVIWNAEHPAELAAQFGLIRPAAVLRAGAT